jgi:transposase
MNRDTAASEPGTQARHNGVLSPALRHGRFQPAADCREVNDRVEIPDIKPDVTRVTLQGGVRPRCAKKFKAAPPSGMEPGSPFGENLHALVIYLCFTQGIAFGRLARLPSYILGLHPHASHVGSHHAIRRDRPQGRQRNWWLWVFHPHDSAVFFVEPSRGKKVVEGFLGMFRSDFWISDRYGGQMGWA